MANKNSPSQERDFKGVWIHRELYLSRDLSWTEKILLIEIDSLDKDDKGCFASNQHLADFLGIKVTSLANMISKLRKAGFLEQLWFDGRNRGLRVHFKDVQPSQKNEGRVNKKVKQPSQKSENEPSQKCEHSNTYKELSNTEREEEGANAPLNPPPPQAVLRMHSDESSRSIRPAITEPNKPSESQAAYLARKQTEFPLIDVAALFKRYCEYCREHGRPPQRGGFDIWCANEEPPMEVSQLAHATTYINPMTGRGLA